MSDSPVVAAAAARPDARARERALEAARARLAESDFDAALTLLAPLLEADPDDVNALYMRAVVLRYAGHLQAALSTLDRLKRVAPNHGRAYQEEGHVHRALRQPDAALRAYARASQYNPALEASLRGQIEILQQAGRIADAARVVNRLQQLLALPKPLVAVTDLIAQGKLVRAEKLCRAFLKKNPRHVEGMRLLADIGVRLGVLNDAEFLLESALAFDPDHAAARIDYVQVLRKRQKFARAREQAEQLLQSAPDNVQFQSLYAVESMQTGDFDTALDYFDRILKRLPRDPVTHTSRGHALKTCGRTSEAIEAYRQALVSLPTHGEAWYSLANLKTYRFDDGELAAMQAQQDNPDLGHMDRVHLAFALGKAWEDRREYGRAFEHYARGNALKKAESRYNADRIHEEFEAIAALCDRGFFEARAGWGHDAPDPIFIVGLPRAGSTLLEQILASHSQVDGTLELPNVMSLAQRLRRRRTRAGRSGAWPAILTEIDADEFREFGKSFIEDTRIHRQQAPLFIDKMPNNFRHLALIQLMLPNAKIIDARRQPMACCFSGFKQLFAEGQEFTYDLADAGRYYRDYVALMAHWDVALPGRVLRIMHEDVVDDLEGQVRRLLDFCELPFEDACLRYWETERNVRTPSSEQVRRPIFRDSVEQWRNFEPWLTPLKQALGPELTADLQL